MFSHFWFLISEFVAAWREYAKRNTPHHQPPQNKCNKKIDMREYLIGRASLAIWQFIKLCVRFCVVEHSILHFEIKHRHSHRCRHSDDMETEESEREPLIRSVLSCLRKGTLIIFSLIFPHIQLHSAHIDRLSGARIQISNFGRKKKFWFAPISISIAPHTMLQWQSTDMSCSSISFGSYGRIAYTCVCVSIAS